MRLSLPVPVATFSGPSLASQPLARVSFLHSLSASCRSSQGNSLVHELMDVMCSCCGVPRLTPHKIRAERSSNLSVQKLRGAGLTPHFHVERSSNASLRSRISSLCSPPSLPPLSRSTVFLLWPTCVPWLCFDRRYVNQGPPCGLTVAFEGVLLFASVHLFVSLALTGIVHD